MEGQAPPTRYPLVQVEAGFERTWPGASRLSSACAMNLFALQSLLEKRSHAWVVREGYSSSAAFNMLTVLHGADAPLLPSQIAERMLVSRPTITDILYLLERKGQIRRTVHPRDGRMRLVEIAPHMRRHVANSMRRLHLFEREFIGALSRADQATLLRLLGELQRSISGIDPAVWSRRPRSSDVRPTAPPR